MDKLEELKKRLLSYDKAAIAYSGGVDSHFLLMTALGAMGRERVLPVLVHGCMMAGEDFEEAKNLLQESGARYVILEADVLQVPQFASNDKLRCYYCKKFLMSMIQKEATNRGCTVLLDGKNQDDGKYYRPGARAAEELGIQSPLAETGISKGEIRAYSRQMGLATSDKPSNSCLASRFPYDTLLTEELLCKAEQAEKCLKGIGIYDGRVRVHGDVARIEINPCQWEKILQNENLTEGIKACGFAHVTLDLEGYRSGSYDL